MSLFVESIFSEKNPEKLKLVKFKTRIKFLRVFNPNNFSLFIYVLCLNIQKY